MATVRCLGVTEAKRRCKRKVQPPYKYCYQHRTHTKLPLKYSFVPEPCERIRRMVVTHIHRKPSKKDKPGYIYAYDLEEDKDVNYVKIGRTYRTVPERLAEWKDARLLHFVSVKHAQWSERLCHLLLDAVRLYRYRSRESGKYKLTVKKNDPPPSNDQCKGLRKEIEWFEFKNKTDAQCALNFLKTICMT